MANDTPESEFSIECFQNYSAPEVFIQGLAGMVNQTDIETMIRAQKQMLQRFEKTNEMLTNCNALSASRLKVAGTEFKKHTQLLVDMKKDLDYIFKKIRLLKTKLSAQYPEAFEIAQKAALAKASLEKDDDDFDQSLERQNKPSTSLNKDMSNSTETLKPSVSQIFNKSPNDTESKELAEDNKIKLSNEKQTAVNELTADSSSSQHDVGQGAAKTQDSVGCDTKEEPKKKTVIKVDRNSSGSSSSDNSSNNCSVSSGDNTSDTG